MQENKVIHFGDGPFSVKEDDLEIDIPLEIVENSHEQEWLPWMKYMTSNAASNALKVCDYMGESLASFFGITTPKYQYEINEYHRMLKEKEDANLTQKDLEQAGWVPKDSTIPNVAITDEQPGSSNTVLKF